MWRSRTLEALASSLPFRRRGMAKRRDRLCVTILCGCMFPQAWTMGSLVRHESNTLQADLEMDLTYLLTNVDGARKTRTTRQQRRVYIHNTVTKKLGRRQQEFKECERSSSTRLPLHTTLQVPSHQAHHHIIMLAGALSSFKSAQALARNKTKD